MSGRSLRAALVAALVSAVVGVVIASPPASARKVGNPGTGFTLKVQSGALRIRDKGFEFVDEGRNPQCSDGTNNDGTPPDGQDSNVDYPADAQCSSATDDSETQPGFQPKLPILMNNGTIDGAGNVTFPQSGVSFPPQYLFVNADDASGGAVDDFIVTIQIFPIANFVGHINPLNGSMDLRMQVRVSATGGPLSSGCGVNPIDINALITGTTSPPAPNTPISGIPYDTATGRTTIVNNDYGVPGASNCGTIALFFNLNDQINSQLGLPSPGGNNEAKFLVEYTPTKVTAGIVPSFTATPSSGPAPLSVAFNAGASTGTGLSYAWDFDSNGSTDATGVTASRTYNTAGSYTAKLTVTDTDGDSAVTTRLISVGANLPPTANDQTVSTAEDTTKNITLTGSDPEGSALTYSLVSPAPTHGTLTGTAPNVTYTPNANYHGPDSFGFKVVDGFGTNNDTGLVTVNVTPVNDAPVAANVSANTTEDNATTVSLVAADVDGDALAYSVESAPTKGTLSAVSGNSVTYTPFANQNGVDTFTFKATDSSNVASNTATATVTIASVNDAPTANAANIATDEDTPVPITLTGSDVEPGSLTFGIVTQPAHGSLGGALPNLTYTPAANYNGPDAFVFKVTDSSGSTSSATVDIAVASVNDAPSVADASIGTNQDTPVTVSVAASDADGDALTYTPATPTAGGGTVECSANDCTYTPAAGFSGSDSYTVLVDDGNGGTGTATVSVSVSALNNTQPVLGDAEYVLLEDQPRNFTLAGTDADGDPLSYAVTNAPAHGTLACSTAGVCSFAPEANNAASQAAIVQASDGRGGLTFATITLTVVPINDVPTVAPTTLVTDEDASANTSLAATDADGDALTWVIKRAALHGTVTCSSAGVCGYTPASNYNGADSFEAEVNDGHGGRVRITVPITVNAVNDAPTAGTTPITLGEDAAAVAFNLSGADVDGNSISFNSDASSLGTLNCSSSGACSFTPNANANGVEAIGYTVSDGTLSTTGVVLVNIAPVNDAPVAAPASMGTDEDTPIAFTLGATDVDDSALTYNLTSAPAQGALFGVAPNLTYRPATNASGAVSFGYRVTDAAGATSTATVSITVNPVNDAPVANSYAVTTPEDTAKGIALSGSDVEGPVTVTVTAPPVHGTYSGGTYTPALNFSGTDAIGFRVTDSGNQVADGVVSITITPVNDAPKAFSSTVVTSRATPVPITLTANDPDGDALAWAILTGPSHGALSGTAPNLTYTPAGLYTGADAFTFKVTDPSGSVSSATISISVTTANITTSLVVGPATVTKPVLVGNYKYTNLNATLRTTSGSVPIPNQTVTFAVNGTTICSAKTNASGVATCSGTGPRKDATTYLGKFNGSPGYLPSSGNGALS